MSSPPRRPGGAPLPPNTRPIGEALAGSEALTLLTRRLHESQARLAAIANLLPPALRAHVKAGPVDELGWTLLTDSNAVSAKLRQMLPDLETHLQQQGWPALPLRVRLLSG